MDAETISMIETLGLGRADYSISSTENDERTISSLEKKVEKLKLENGILKTKLKSLKTENRKLRKR